MAIPVTEVVRNMRGGAQSRLMLAEDQSGWVVKLQTNPQGLRILANELLVSLLGRAIGLPIPDAEIVEISPHLATSIDLITDFGRSRLRTCIPGRHFGSRFVGSLTDVTTVDRLLEDQLTKVSNLHEFAGILALDKWTSNCDGRQCVFLMNPRHKRYETHFIDQGFCFNANSWDFPDSPLRGVHARNTVYAGTTGWDSFSPWLERIESMDATVIWNFARTVPPEWYENDLTSLQCLVDHLLKRRSRVRDLILSFRTSDRVPFPRWNESVQMSVRGAVSNTAVNHPVFALHSDLKNCGR